MNTKLYGLNKDGSYKIWSINVVNNGETSTIEISHGVEGGQVTIATENITTGKQKRSHFEQAVLQAQARVKKNMDKGYRETKEELTTLPLLPMLAADYLKVGHRIKFPCYTSVKYDGVRCLATKHAGEVRLESRTGQPYSVPHIEESLNKMMHDGDVYDGELYLHGYELQDITSAVKRTDPDKEIESATKKHKKISSNLADSVEMTAAKRIKYIRENMQFHIFDIPMDGTFEDRIAYLDESYKWGKNLPYIKFTHYDMCDSDLEMKSLHKRAVQDGFEGLMLRNLSGVYESGKRSADLQKYKEFMDEEFEILDIVSDKQGDGVFVLRNNLNELTFQCVMGTLHERNQYLKFKQDYIGKWLKVKFQSRYKGTLIPQFPVGLMIREGYAVNGSFVPFD